MYICIYIRIYIYVDIFVSLGSRHRVLVVVVDRELAPLFPLRDLRAVIIHYAGCL